MSARACLTSTVAVTLVVGGCARAPSVARASREAGSAVPTSGEGAGDPSTPTSDVPRADAGEGPQVADDRTGAKTSTGPYRVATFNAGLAVGVVTYASERAPLVIDALASADLDLVCVQEVWLDQHWQQLVNATGTRLPTAMRIEPTLGAQGPTCTRAELAPLRTCATSSCAGLASDQLAACVIQRCAAVAERISVSCVNCVARDPSGTLQSITEACVQEGTAPTPHPGARGGMVAYGGSFGLGLLTRSPVLERDALRLRSVLNPRGVLYAKVVANGRELHAFCTHLTPDIAGLAHPSEGSWRQDHAAEVLALLEFVEQKTRGHEPALLLGDLNAGPAVGGAITARLPDDYSRFLAAGFSNAYVKGGRAECTYCSANPLVGGTGRSGSLIDHVLTRDIVAPEARVQPFLRQPITVTVGTSRRRTAYSDHYGLTGELGGP